MSDTQIVTPSFDKSLGGQKSWSLNPSALWGDDIIILEEENIAEGAAVFTEHVPLADFNNKTTFSVDINNGTSIVTAKIYFTNEPGTDLTILQYWQDPSCPNTTSDTTWVLDYPVRAARIVIDATAGGDADCYIYASRS